LRDDAVPVVREVVVMLATATATADNRTCTRKVRGRNASTLSVIRTGATIKGAPSAPHAVAEDVICGEGFNDLGQSCVRCLQKTIEGCTQVEV